MSKMTFACYLRLHVMQLGNIEYQKGYEYAKKLTYFKSMDVDRLFEVLRSYIDVGIKYKDAYAFGHAQVIRELIWARLEGEIIGASN